MAVRVRDNSEQIKRKALETSDLVLSAVTTDIFRLSQIQVPLKKGTLQSSGIITKPRNLTYRIGYHTPYASYQHRGERLDGSHVVKKYSYPGKKKHYVTDPAQTIMKNIRSYIQRYAK